MNIHNRIFDTILTPQEYAQRNYKIPYILKLQNSRQGIFFYGCKHSHNPKNQQFQEIERLLEECIRKYGSEKMVVMIENATPPIEESREQMIKKYGESGLTAYLGNKHHLTSECPEQPTVKLNQFVLEKGFAKNDLMLWIFLNKLWFVSATQPITNEGITNIIDVLKKNGNIRLEDWMPKFQRRVYELINKKLIPEKIEDLMHTKMNREEIKNLQDPFRKGTVLNDIGSLLNHARDRYIANHFLHLLNKRKTVFAVFGWNHVVALEQFLRQRMDYLATS